LQSCCIAGRCPCEAKLPTRLIERTQRRAESRWFERRRPLLEFDAAIFTELERAILLHVPDRHWREHLHELAILRDGLQSRSTDRSDALAGYRREAAELFQKRRELIGRETVTYLFTARVQAAEQA